MEKEQHQDKGNCRAKTRAIGYAKIVGGIKINQHQKTAIPARRFLPQR